MAEARRNTRDSGYEPLDHLDQQAINSNRCRPRPISELSFRDTVAPKKRLQSGANTTNELQSEQQRLGMTTCFSIAKAVTFRLR
jgi:hypothetical protein